MLHPPGTYEYHTPLRDKPDAVLPFGAMNLVLYQTEKGYQVLLQDPATGDTSYAGEFLTEQLHCPDKNLPIAWFNRAMDAKRPYSHTPELLITPGMPDPGDPLTRRY